jgi:hypothetical protein
MGTARTVRTDRLRGGELVIGTTASGPYEDGPRRLAERPTEAPEHSVRATAYWLAWTDGRRQVYYGDTRVLVAR